MPPAGKDGESNREQSVHYFRPLHDLTKNWRWGYPRRQVLHEADMIFRNFQRDQKAWQPLRAGAGDAGARRHIRQGTAGARLRERLRGMSTAGAGHLPCSGCSTAAPNQIPPGSNRWPGQKEIPRRQRLGISSMDDIGLEPMTSRTSSGCSYQLS